ncbi:MAG: hypothetical protein AB7W16_02265 [Candidatus Obscuribacterales bacterium]
MNRKGFFIATIAGLLLALSLVLYIRGLSAEEAWLFEEYAGIAILCLIAVAGFSIISTFSLAELIFGLMEQRADNLLRRGSTNAARHWYERCLVLDDRLLNNTMKRVVIMGKLARAYGDLGKSKLARRMDDVAASVRAGNPEPLGSLHRGSSLSDSIKDSWLYKYAFAILFGTVGLGYGLIGNVQTGWILLLVGSAINIYWLHVDSQDA